MKFKKVTKDELAKRAKFNKKHNKGMSWFQNGMGDPAKEAEMFNHMQGGSAPTSAVDAGGCEGCAVGESLTEDQSKSNKEIFIAYAKPRIKDLNTIEYDDEDCEVLMQGDIREFNNCNVIRLEDDPEVFAWIDENGKYHSTPMYTPHQYAADMFFNFISQDYYNEIIEYWDDLDMDEIIDENRASEITAVDESLGSDKDKIFAQIKEINPNAKEENYIDKSVNQMLAILYKLRNNNDKQTALDILNDAEEIPFTGVKRDNDGMLYHYENGVKGELATEEESETQYFEQLERKLDESLNIIDIETDNKYDLRTSFRSLTFSDAELSTINKLVESNEIKNISKTLNKKLQESFDNWTESTDGEVIAELTNSMLDWNYNKDEIEAAFVYCEQNNIDYKKLEDWEFEYIIMYVNGYEYNPLVHETQDDWDTEFYDIIDRAKAVNESYNLRDGWTASDIKLHQSIDWGARNYRDYPVESDTFIGNATLYGQGAPKIKECKFVKYIRANEIYPPYYAPIEDPFTYVVGPMYDGNKHGRYDIHDRYETTEAYDMLSR